MDFFLFVAQSTLTANSNNSVVLLVRTSSPLSTACGNPERTEADDTVVFTVGGDSMAKPSG